MKDPRPLRWLLLGLAFAFLMLFVGLPVVAVFVEAFRKGADAYWAAIRDPETISAVKLTVITAAISVPMNLVFGSSLELIAIAGVAFAVNAIAQDGETTWFEGTLLVAVYALLSLAFFYVTPGS